MKKNSDSDYKAED